MFCFQRLGKSSWNFEKVKRQTTSNKNKLEIESCIEILKSVLKLRHNSEKAPSEEMTNHDRIMPLNIIKATRGVNKICSHLLEY